MCIAILNTKKAGRLPKQQIKNSWDNNNMGGGLLWSKGGKLNVFKSYEYFDFLDKYNEIRDDKSVGNIVLHFRIATSGYNGEHNLHPFLVNNNLGFVHNGVISGLGNKSFSDTYQFNDILKKFKHNFITCDTTKYFISEYIGYSKLVFLDSKDRYTIINEELGKWTDSNWYSNDSYKTYNDYVYYGNKKVSKTSATPYTTTVDEWDDWDYDYTKDTIKKDDSAEQMYDEWTIYESLCDMYGLDPNDDDSYSDIERFMNLSNCEDIIEFWHLVNNDQPTIIA
jgi:predicted glutamine amidotransferase